MGIVCTLFGVTRQAYYEAEIHERKTTIARMIVLTIVKELRDEIPLIGTRKLLFLLGPHLEEHGIKMGRDQLFDLLRFHGLLIRRRKRLVKTTNSHHWLRFYRQQLHTLLVKKISKSHSRYGYYITRATLGERYHLYQNDGRI